MMTTRLVPAGVEITNVDEPGVKRKAKGKRMRRDLITIAAAACIAAGGAWISADWYKMRKDPFASRPDKCKEATARIVESTGGLLKASGAHDDVVEIADEPHMTVKIDCGSSDDTVSFAMYSDGQYLRDRWFTVAAMAAHGLTGDPVGEIAKAARSCLENGTNGRL